MKPAEPSPTEHSPTEHSPTESIPAELAPAIQERLEAAAFRRLLAHLDERKDVQNIDLMNLAGFCRNCLSKWYMAAAEEQGLSLDYDRAREHIYGMRYEEWKSKYQK